MRLPRPDAVVVDVRKVRDYLLSATHPVGQHKARFFAALGFTEASAALFISEVRRIANSEDVLAVEDTAFGRKYTVVGQLTGPKGTAQVETVWFEEAGVPSVRLVTVVPRSS